MLLSVLPIDCAPSISSLLKMTRLAVKRLPHIILSFNCVKSSQLTSYRSLGIRIQVTKTKCKSKCIETSNPKSLRLRTNNGKLIKTTLGLTIDV